MPTARDRRKSRYVNTREAIAKQEAGGFAPTTFTLPEGVSEFRFEKAGTYRLDIIPFVVGEGNPQAEPGDWYYERTYEAHKGIGANNEMHTCPRLTRKERCPICEFRAKVATDPNGDEVTADLLKPKRRQLFLVIDTKDRDKGVQVFETAHFMMFGELLKDKIKSGDNEDDPDAPGEYDNFWHLDDGLTLKVSVVESTFEDSKGNVITFMKPKIIEMIPRTEQYEESMIDDVPCLDDLLVVKDYDDLKEVFHQVDGEDEDVAKKPKPSANGKPAAKKKPPVDDDEEDEMTAEDAGIEVGMKVTHEEFGECEVKHISGDGTSLRIEDEDGELHKAVSPKDVEIVEDKPKGKKPAGPAAKGSKPMTTRGSGKTTAKAASSPSDDEDEEPEDEPDEEDEEPTPTKRGGKKAAVDEDEEPEEEMEFDEEDEEPAPKKKPRR